MDEIIAAAHSLVINDQCYRDGDISVDEYWEVRAENYRTLETFIGGNGTGTLTEACRYQIKYAEAARFVGMRPTNLEE